MCVFNVPSARKAGLGRSGQTRDTHVVMFAVWGVRGFGIPALISVFRV